MNSLLNADEVVSVNSTLSLNDAMVYFYNHFEYYMLWAISLFASLVVIKLCIKNRSLFIKTVYVYVIALLDAIVSIMLVHHMVGVNPQGGKDFKFGWILLKIVLILFFGSLFPILLNRFSDILKTPIHELYLLLSSHSFGIGTFVYLLITFILNAPKHIEEWCALWYATDYSMGGGSRFFIGSVLRLFYNDYLSSSVAYRFCYISIIIIILFVSYMIDKMVKLVEPEIRSGVGFLIILFLVSPGSVPGIWQKGDFGRLETYGLLLMLCGIVLFEKLKNKYSKYTIITLVSMISLAIYQGNLFLYYPLVLMVIIYDVFTDKNDVVKRILGVCSFVFSVATFAYFQFFAWTYFDNAVEMAEFLEKKTDLPIAEAAIDYELFQSVLGAYIKVNLGYLRGSELPREKTVLTAILLTPVILIIIYLFTKCIENSNSEKWYKQPYIYLVLISMFIIPQYVLNVDWGRWMIATSIIVFSELFYLLYKKDDAMTLALTNFTSFLMKHKIFAVFLIIYVASLDKFDQRIFMGQVNQIVGWMVDCGVLHNGWM